MRTPKEQYDYDNKWLKAMVAKMREDDKPKEWYYMDIMERTRKLTLKEKIINLFKL